MQGDLAMSSTLARNVHNELMMVNLRIHRHLLLMLILVLYVVLILLVVGN